MQGFTGSCLGAEDLLLMPQIGIHFFVNQQHIVAINPLRVMPRTFSLRVSTIFI
jgi:hypothetical protein